MTNIEDANTAEVKWWQEKPVWVMLFLGFSAGVPILLIFGTLSLWLREAGVSRSTATFFSWAILGYSFKFIWAPLIDQLPIPVLTKMLGRRRSWILFSQMTVISSITLMAFTDPKTNLTAMAIAAVCLGFASATQDIVIDAYRIESAPPRLQAMLATTYITGYRIGMMMAGAVALSLAEGFGSTADSYSYLAWQKTYLIVAATMLIGVLTTLFIREPTITAKKKNYANRDYFSFIGTFIVSIAAFAGILWLSPKAPELFSGGTQSLFKFIYNTVILFTGLGTAYAMALLSSKRGLINQRMVDESYIQPVQDFFSRYGKLAVWMLMLILFYRISDIVLGVIANVFYQDMGYSKTQIGALSKAFGLVVSIFGSFISGIVALRIGVLKTLQGAAVFVVATNLLFCWLTLVGQDHTNINLTLPFYGTVNFPLELAVVITFDNLAQGFSTVAFIAWMSSLTNISFTATQYAIFSSIMTLFPKIVGGYSGTLVDTFGYTQFFLFASAIGIPVIFLIHFLKGQLEYSDNQSK
ncbi:MFS transporter [Arenicella sp. 4NH20-0111]|uniref:AmpG family muropeptide MFS transporter n=1 Tax=Arenicella sp. 4NH20-0111 TaxID=3127648 RepID=UPI0031046C23